MKYQQRDRKYWKCLYLTLPGGRAHVLLDTHTFPALNSQSLLQKGDSGQKTWRTDNTFIKSHFNMPPRPAKESLERGKRQWRRKEKMMRGKWNKIRWMTTKSGNKERTWKEMLWIILPFQGSFVWGVFNKPNCVIGLMWNWNAAVWAGGGLCHNAKQ